MGQIIMRNWDLGDFRVRVNLPSPIQQVRVLIRHVITLIRGLPNPTWQVVPLISHIRLYPPHHYHLHPPSLSFSSTTSTIIAEYNGKSSLSISPCHDHELTPSTSIHQVQHTQSTAYTKYSIHQVQHTRDCLSSLRSHDYELNPEYSFSFRGASLHDRLPSASLQ